MRSQALGFGLVAILALVGCGKKKEENNQINGYYKVTSIMEGARKGAPPQLMLVHFENGKTKSFSAHGKNKGWKDSGTFTVTNDVVKTVNGKETTEVKYQLKGKQLTFTAVKATEDVKEMVMEKITKEEAERLMAEANKAAGPEGEEVPMGPGGHRMPVMPPMNIPDAPPAVEGVPPAAPAVTPEKPRT